jgi:hypothetical protein
MCALRDLLARAQQARSVRHDIDTADVMALITGFGLDLLAGIKHNSETNPRLQANCLDRRKYSN